MPHYEKGTYKDVAGQSEVWKFDVRNVNDTFGTNDRAGVELFAFDASGNQVPIVTVIPGKRVRIHNSKIGLQGDSHPEVKMV